MSHLILQLKGVTKAYSAKIAVDNISLDIPRGSVFGLLGPNGAGKTSIIRMITSITAPDKGEILFDGIRLKEEHTARIGYMPEERGLYRKMKVGEHLVYLLQLRGISRKEASKKTMEWLERLSIVDWVNKQVGELSKGMQQKVQFIATVAHEPELLILDEPFSGLDPINSQIITKEIEAMRAGGTTLIFSTHRMEQVEELCERIALIDDGRIILESGLAEAREKYRKNLYHLEFKGNPDALKTLKNVSLGSITENKIMESTEVVIELSPGTIPGTLLQQLGGLEIDLLRFQVHIPRLNEIFIETVQNSKAHV